VVFAKLPYGASNEGVFVSIGVVENSWVGAPTARPRVSSDAKQHADEPSALRHCPRCPLNQVK